MWMSNINKTRKKNENKESKRNGNHEWKIRQEVNTNEKKKQCIVFLAFI